MKSYNGTPITYDDIGNPIQYGADNDADKITYEWEKGRQLKKMVKNGETVEFKYFQNISRTVDAVWREQARIQLRSKLGTLIKQTQAELAKLEKQRDNLKQEVLKSLSGESLFDTKMLKSLLDENTAAIAAAEKKIEQYQDDREKEAERINFLAEQYRQIADWAEEFGAANNDTKKMILARIIEKITVDRNYHITMTFFITEDDFREKAMESASKLEIVEAEDGIWRPRSTHAG